MNEQRLLDLIATYVNNDFNKLYKTNDNLVIEFYNTITNEQTRKIESIIIILLDDNKNFDYKLLDNKIEISIII